MTDEDRISRRATIKGIATTGALIGGSILGASSASAGHENDCIDNNHRKKYSKYKKKGKKYDGYKKKGKKYDGYKKKGKKYDGYKKKGKKYDGYKKKGKKYKKRKYLDVKDQVSFNFECVDPYKQRAKFLVHHGKDRDLKFTYRVAETGKKGTILVRDGVVNSEFLWVKAPKGKATVTLYYKGKRVGYAKSDPNEHC
ncbi:hypothetical protein [Natrialbaceae archaeon AArc-T1-2]|uniref:hypothetical protein n=1 Tax=Natrialbaceae archaeon AArc-T1-2 TaxID=3053904 RepID=UPI00255AA207|nr:hypothetical protein [Natrialbaceae archaeon AArc-T1-2]WIV66703.1 hypothetical protein QQ977_13530 [Natrialbaceae archaeon AArc-T1-2]